MEKEPQMLQVSLMRRKKFVPISDSMNESKKGWQLSQAASPLNVLGVLLFSELAYCARAAISSALSARL